ncbi:nuclear transport factor 2 family protein [Duganella sp. BJB1802]|uniref:nuclear transport factor 2 family protein n=1 Tax=Duganella sp. BJB1802 TaxID=2744575 RepID=UPI0015932089|nr:nuclear transport factor 2 family protein [Duganella sp. BJB1802]NVD73740.1 nuclear transport factor 2 family protein [Duganella sp. BJB1802]
MKNYVRLERLIVNNVKTSALDDIPSDSEGLRKVKALYRALKSKDQQLIKEILVDEPVWDVSPGFPEGAIYRGISEVFGGFYHRLLARVHSFGAFPDKFVDGGDTVVALGHYRITKNEGGDPALVRFSHVWGIDDKGRVKGVWQVADSAQFFAS